MYRSEVYVYVPEKELRQKYIGINTITGEGMPYHLMCVQLNAYSMCLQVELNSHVGYSIC